MSDSPRYVDDDPPPISFEELEVASEWVKQNLHQPWMPHVTRLGLGNRFDVEKWRKRLAAYRATLLNPGPELEGGWSRWRRGPNDV